jgi:hypothetical protein
MNVVKTVALAAGGAVVTAIGVLAASAAQPNVAAEREFAPEHEDEPGYDETGGYRHEDTLTRLTALPALVPA